MDRTLILRFDARILVLVGAVLVIVAVWLPWADLPTFIAGDLARRGVESGGLLTLGLGVLAILSLSLPWRPLRRVSLLAACLGALTNLIALMALVRVVQLSSGLGMDLGAQLGSVGSGLYLTFAGVVLMLFGGLADAEPTALTFEPTEAAKHQWTGYAVRAALVGALLASCLCAWGIGLLTRPYTLTTSAPIVATFGPAPTAFLATPLVDVHLAPLGSTSVITASSPEATPTLTSLPATSTPVLTGTTLPTSPTARVSTRTPLPLPTVPIFTASPTPLPPTATSTPLTSPLATPTRTSTPSATPTSTSATTTTTTATPTLTATRTATPTFTSTPVTPSVTPPP